MTQVFKVCVNIKDRIQIPEIVLNLDRHLCLGKFIPNDPIGFCIGVKIYKIENELVKLAIWTVNESMDRPWIRSGGVEIDYHPDDFEHTLYQTAKMLKM